MTDTNIDLPTGVPWVPHPGPDTYPELLRAAPTTSACPIWLGPAARRYTAPDQVVPDLARAVDAVDPGSTLAAWWPGPCSAGCRCLDPFVGDFPGLARPQRTDRALSPSTVRAAAAFGEAASDLAALATVDATRPADIPAVLGWTGPYHQRHQDLVGISSVLRSWEDRFGALLVWLSGATILLSVGSPPTSVRESEQVAAEHFAFCPDQIDPQDGRDPFSPRTYARTIRRADLWRFWWD